MLNKPRTGSRHSQLLGCIQVPNYHRVQRPSTQLNHSLNPEALLGTHSVPVKKTHPTTTKQLEMSPTNLKWGHFGIGSFTTSEVRCSRKTQCLKETGPQDWRCGELQSITPAGFLLICTPEKKAACQDSLPPQLLTPVLFSSTHFHQQVPPTRFLPLPSGARGCPRNMTGGPNTVTAHRGKGKSPCLSTYTVS